MRDVNSQRFQYHIARCALQYYRSGLIAYYCHVCLYIQTIGAIGGFRFIAICSFEIVAKHIINTLRIKQMKSGKL